MNELYAVDPAAAAEPRRLAALLEKFKASEGRFIGEYPSDWRSEVGKRLEERTIKDKELFERFRTWSGLLGVNEPYVDKDGWVLNAVRLRVEGRLFEMVFGESSTPDGAVTAIDDLVNYKVELKNSRESFVSSDPSHYARVCRPLFLMSKEVVLYDYKFSTCFEHQGVKRMDNKRLRVLEKLISEIASTGVKKRFLLVMNKKHVNSFRDYLAKHLSAVKRVADPESKVDFRYVLDDTSFPGASGHPRCIFGVKAGLRFDQGFQVLKVRNLVNWLDNETLKPFQRKLLPHFHQFTALPSVV